MHWHAQRIRSTRAVVLRGYRSGSYAAQSPYNALMLVLTHKGKHQIQGMLSDSPLKKRDLVNLSRLCARQGLRVASTRRHGKQVTMTSI